MRLASTQKVRAKHGYLGGPIQYARSSQLHPISRVHRAYALADSLLWREFTVNAVCGHAGCGLSVRRPLVSNMVVHGSNSQIHN